MSIFINNPFTSIIKLFDDLFAGGDEKLINHILSEDSKDIFLTAPDILITLYKSALHVSPGLNIEATQITYSLNRITIFPSASWEITLYHKDHALSHESDMKKYDIANNQKV